MGHRRGKGQILTADQLAEKLAVPCYYILQGRANAAFPFTSTPAPSDFVQIVLTRSLLRRADATFFDVTVNWKQWNEVVVPILENNQWRNWQGSTGGQTSTSNGSIPTILLGAGLYNCDQDGYILLLRESLRQQAINCGFGSPDQVPLVGGSD